MSEAHKPFLHNSLVYSLKPYQITRLKFTGGKVLGIIQPGSRISAGFGTESGAHDVVVSHLFLMSAAQAALQTFWNDAAGRRS
jgi:hypothetical protein